MASRVEDTKKDEKDAKCALTRRLMINKETVTTWVKRWNDSPEAGAHERLKDLPRPGAPDKFTPEQVCLIITMACESPETYGRPITHWTARELAEEVSQQNIVDSISITHTGRLLKKRFTAASEPLLVKRQTG